MISGEELWNMIKEKYKVYVSRHNDGSTNFYDSLSLSNHHDL